MTTKNYFPMLLALITTLFSSQIIFAQQEIPIPDYQLTAQIGRGTIEHLQFSSDNTQLAGITTRGIWIYDTNNLNLTPQLFAPNEMNTLLTDGMAINPTFTLGAGTNELGQVLVWNIQTETIIYHFEDIFSADVHLLFSPDGSYLAAISPENWVIWSVIDGTIIQNDFSEAMFAPNMIISQIVFNRAETELGVMALNPIGDTMFNAYRIVKTDTGELVDSFILQEIPYVDPLIIRFAFQEDTPSIQLLIDEIDELRDATATLSRFGSPEIEGFLVSIPFSDPRTVYSISSDYNLFAITGRTEDLRIWDIGTALDYPPCPEPSSLNPESAIAVNYDNCDSSWQALISTTNEHSMQTLFDANETTRLINRYENEYISVNNQWAIFAPPNLIRWTQQESVNLVHRDGREIQLNIPDDLILGYMRNPILMENQIIIVWSGGSNPAFSGEGLIIIWDIDKENTIQEASSVTVADDRNAINAVAINPGNTHLITTSQDGTTQIWDIETLISEIVIESDMIFTDVAFGDDGETILTLGQDGVIHVWTVSQSSN